MLHFLKEQTASTTMLASTTMQTNMITIQTALAIVSETSLHASTQASTTSTALAIMSETPSTVLGEIYRKIQMNMICLNMNHLQS